MDKYDLVMIRAHQWFLEEKVAIERKLYLEYKGWTKYIIVLILLGTTVSIYFSYPLGLASNAVAAIIWWAFGKLTLRNLGKAMDELTQFNQKWEAVQEFLNYGKEEKGT